MASRPYDSNPWPAATPAPPIEKSAAFSSSSDVQGRSLKRRRVHSDHVQARGGSTLAARQGIADQDVIDRAKRNCEIFSGNDVISCYPTADTTVYQHQYAPFVWNSRRPELTQTNLVNIYVFRGDSREQVLNMTNVTNPRDQAGYVTALVDDKWFGTAGEKFTNQPLPLPFYWVITRNDRSLDGNEISQTIFTAIQTTVLDSVAAAQSSASASSASASSAAAASSSSAAAASSSSLASLTSRVTTINGTPTTLTGTAALPTGPGNLQSGSSSDDFPRWAIAVIVVLGFFAIAAMGALIFLIIRRIRRRNQSENDSHRNSMGSSSPMMANVQQASPLLGGSALPAPQRPASLRRNDSHIGGQNAPSVVLHDGESGISGEGGPFSGADAAIMADAFRKMLRKPDFAGHPVEEGESPDTVGDNNQDEGQHILNRELAEEGRDLRSVSSSRGVKVESHSEHGDSHRP